MILVAPPPLMLLVLRRRRRRPCAIVDLRPLCIVGAPSELPPIDRLQCAVIRHTGCYFFFFWRRRRRNMLLLACKLGGKLN